MMVERITGWGSGYKLFLLKVKHPFPEMTWKKEWYRISICVWRDTYGRHLGVNLA